MKFLKHEWVLIGLLLLLAITTRFLFFGHPDRIVFDELYFAKFVSQYFLHSYYFDIHPPLAKLIMAGIAGIAGFHPDFSFGYDAINDVYPDSLYLLLRGIVSVFGVLLPLGVYLLSRALRFSKLASFLGGLFIVLDNALLVQSRFILTDVFFLTFGVFGLALVIFSLRDRHISYGKLMLGSLLLGACYAVKWTGLLFLGLGILYAIIRYITDRRALPLQKLLYAGGTILICSFLVYNAAMAIHILELNKTGTGDAFMSVGFQSTLVGSSYAQEPGIEKPSLTSKIMELNGRMFSANAGITAGHPYGSKWYTWPFMERSVYYWYNNTDSTHDERIYFIGNPLIWWGGLAVMFYLLVISIRKFLKKDKNFLWPLAFILIAFFANLLAYIPISRVAFLYHYLPSLIFLCIGLGYVLSSVKKWWIGVLALALIVGAFLWIAPLSYGTSLTPDAFHSRMLFKSWE